MVNYSELYQSVPVKEFPLQQSKAMEHFLRLGFPTLKDEEWRFTNIAPVISGNFSFPAERILITKEEVIRRYNFLRNAAFVVIENGKWNPAASQLENFSAGV